VTEQRVLKARKPALPTIYIFSRTEVEINYYYKHYFFYNLEYSWRNIRAALPGL
jgi:hypothetical protein